MSKRRSVYCTRETLLTVNGELLTKDLLTVDDKISFENLLSVDGELSTEGILTVDCKLSTEELLTADGTENLFAVENCFLMTCQQ